MNIHAPHREDDRYRALERVMQQQRRRPDSLIEILHAAQRQFGWLDREVLGLIAARLRLPPSLVYGVAGFYHAFRLEPPGRHRCTVCTGTSCHLKGGSRLLQRLERHLGIPCGAATPDGSLTLENVRCLGACGLAPLVMLDGEACPHASFEPLVERLATRRDGGDTSP
ncbi:NAD(P)H-dependent oxidoreductase subunit E [Oryzomonas sagensis]|uniref:NAD(P)H-dependent oxidoreductase subunit E n=1 Tax=Oryzomonas sagensis TaxID=2603857 RepID=A0ABQ6TT75_9BACT|nr:NAD(P)H-dependent oxidoreductase subunit E [Oryzomonas sagensis]KAB0672251.1 NAD(P)H-dependent oxidoreductase subunit E [Oryzomonas sagensis]